MSETVRKYPGSVKSVYIMGSGSEKGHKVDIRTEEEIALQRKTSRRYRPWEKEIRAVSLANAKYFNTYIEEHDASNDKRKNGALKDMPKNARKARKAALKTLKSNSKYFKQVKEPKIPRVFKLFRGPKIPKIGRLSY